MMTPRENDDMGSSSPSGTGAEGDETDLYPTNQRTPRLRNVLETEIVDFGPANIEPLDQADYLAYQLSQIQEEQMNLQRQLEEAQQVPISPIVQHGYQPFGMSPEDDRAVMEAEEIVGPAQRYFDIGYQQPSQPGEVSLQDSPKSAESRLPKAFDHKYGKHNASAPLPLIRRPRGVN
jgi:hypothetical protein